MLANLQMTIQEALRYRGRTGHYSWLVHRLSGLGILSFLLIHVWDGANTHYWPEMYEWSIALFKHPFFGVGEIAIYGCVLYHAFNGIRITILDFKPEWWHYQDSSAKIVWAIFLVIFIPAAIYLLMGIANSCSYAPVWRDGTTGSSCWALPPFAAFGIGN